MMWAVRSTLLSPCRKLGLRNIFKCLHDPSSIVQHASMRRLAFPCNGHIHYIFKMFSNKIALNKYCWHKLLSRMSCFNHTKTRFGCITSTLLLTPVLFSYCVESDLKRLVLNIIFPVAHCESVSYHHDNTVAVECAIGRQPCYSCQKVKLDQDINWEMLWQILRAAHLTCLYLPLLVLYPISCKWKILL